MKSKMLWNIVLRKQKIREIDLRICIIRFHEFLLACKYLLTCYEMYHQDSIQMRFFLSFYLHRKIHITINYYKLTKILNSSIVYIKIFSNCLTEFLFWNLPNILTFSNPLGKDGLKLVESEMIFCRSGVFVTGAGSITSLGIMGFSLGTIGLLATIFSIDSNLGGKISTASSMA